MALFERKPSLQDAIEIVKLALRRGGAQPELSQLGEALRRRDEPLLAGARAPPLLQELLDGLPDAAAVLEAGTRMVARNRKMTLLLGSQATVLEATGSPALAEVCARALAGWPHQRELALPALGLQVQAQVSPLSHARALLVLRDLTAERRGDQVRRDFIANASHELRTPVTAIRAAAETLLEGGVELDAQARSFVQMIARHADRLSRLTEDLLDLSRLETGEWKPMLESIQLAPFCLAALELVRPRAAEKGLALNLDVPERLRALADRRALEQILVNLLDNAIKYTPPAGRVTLLGDGLGPSLMLSVIDTGPGIAAEHQARIFERFYRADVGRSRDLGGTGLGLAIVKHLALQMGGEAGLESIGGSIGGSSSGPGSRFWVKLRSA